jgi:biotin-dependent carboxylase-like uncharacterized protein
MAGAVIDILECPMPVTIQDGGRHGYRHLGVPLSGALDAQYLAIANALVGNSFAAAALEMRLVGPRLRAAAPLTIAVAGECESHIENAQGQRRAAAPWNSHSLGLGDTLVIAKITGGIAYLAVAGGLDLPSVLGSCSTYARAGLGGLEGRSLRGGDCLSVRRQAQPPLLRLPKPPLANTGPIRVLAGPQREYFTEAAWAQFIDCEFTVSREADRMGLRLDGPRLEHNPARGADIVSDAVTPGVIQVPGDCRAIILLADCQTVGGYPKIATIIGADLPRLGHALPGTVLRFVEVDIGQALAARRRAAQALAECIASMVPGGAEIDLDALYDANLIDGVIDAHQSQC